MSWEYHNLELQTNLDTHLRQEEEKLEYKARHERRQEEDRGPYISAHVLLNLLKEMGKRDKMRGFPSILSLFRNEFNRFINT